MFSFIKCEWYREYLKNVLSINCNIEIVRRHQKRMHNSEHYSKAWRRYKNGKRILFAVFIGFYPMLEFILRPIYRYYQNDWILHGYVLIWLFLFMVYFFRVFFFICPRCGNYYFEKWQGWIFGLVGYRSDRCVNCGLAKWSLGDEHNTYDGA